MKGYISEMETRKQFNLTIQQYDTIAEVEGLNVLILPLIGESDGLVFNYQTRYILFTDLLKTMFKQDIQNYTRIL